MLPVPHKLEIRNYSQIDKLVLELRLCPGCLGLTLNPSSVGRDGAPKLAYQSGYNFKYVIYMVHGLSSQLENVL